MTVFKTYMKLLKQSWGFVAPFLVIFLVLSIIFGQSFGDKSANVFETTKIDVVISAPAEHQPANEFEAWLKSQGHDVTRKTLTELDAREQIFSERIKAAYLFLDSEKESPVVFADQKSASGFYAGTMADMFFRFWDAYRTEDGSVDKPSLYHALSQEMSVEIYTSEDTNESASGLESIVGSMSGTAYVLLIISMTLIPLINEAFTRPGVFERTISAPYKTRKRMFEMYLGSALIVFVSAILLYGFSLISIGKHFTLGHFGRVSLNYFLFTLCVLAMSYLLANTTRNRAAISAISTVFSLGLAFLSGAFLPQEMVSDAVLNVSKAFPLYYFIHANRNSLSWDGMVYDLFMQLGFFILYVFIAFILQRMMRRARKTMKAASSTAGDIGA